MVDISRDKEMNNTSNCIERLAVAPKWKRSAQRATTQP